MAELSRAEVQLKLQDVFRAVFDDDSLVLTDATTATDIAGWDSLQQVKIILHCEKAFGIRLRARDINGLENISEMTDHLVAAVNKAARK
ncbi:MAG: acyl carrier protein [Pseudomonadota bacterium]